MGCEHFACSSHPISRYAELHDLSLWLQHIRVSGVSSLSMSQDLLCNHCTAALSLRSLQDTCDILELISTFSEWPNRRSCDSLHCHSFLSTRDLHFRHPSSVCSVRVSRNQGSRSLDFHWFTWPSIWHLASGTGPFVGLRLAKVRHMVLPRAAASDGER